MDRGCGSAGVANFAYASKFPKGKEYKTVRGLRETVGAACRKDAECACFYIPFGSGGKGKLYKKDVCAVTTVDGWNGAFFKC